MVDSLDYSEEIKIMKDELGESIWNWRWIELRVSCHFELNVHKDTVNLYSIVLCISLGNAGGLNRFHWLVNIFLRCFLKGNFLFLREQYLYRNIFLHDLVNKTSLQIFPMFYVEWNLHGCLVIGLGLLFSSSGGTCCRHYAILYKTLKTSDIVQRVLETGWVRYRKSLRQKELKTKKLKTKIKIKC